MGRRDEMERKGWDRKGEGNGSTRAPSELNPGYITPVAQWFPKISKKPSETGGVGCL